MSINGYDDAGVEWDGTLWLDVDDEGNVSGKIEWSGSNGASGTEWVEGTRSRGGRVAMEGTEVAGRAIVPCRYEGTWIGDDITLRWVGSCPSGRAVGGQDS